MTTREVNRLKSTATTTTTFEPQITFAMAEPSGVTEAGLKAGLEERIGATHVEIEDMSGRQRLQLLPSRSCFPVPVRTGQILRSEEGSPAD